MNDPDMALARWFIWIVGGLFLFSVVAIIVGAINCAREPSHGRGCDCGDCSAWYAEYERNSRRRI